jgi:hypothetical protein
MKRLCLIGIVSSLASLPAQAANLGSVDALTQNEFRLLSEDLGAGLSYKPLIPTTPLGIAGFDLGIQATDTQLANSGVFKKATGNNDTTFVLSQARLYKGLPLGFDIGVSYGVVPDSNIKLVGAELRYAIIGGGAATPAVGVRASYTVLTGVDQLDFSTTGIDLSISKGFAFVTPYAGVGQVWVNSTPQGTAALTLTGESFRLNKIYAGLNMNFVFINICVEGDRTGDASTYGVKLGWRF